MDNNKFELFAALLENEKVYMDSGLTFEKICSWIGVNRNDLDTFLEDEFGYGGDDILKVYRGGTALYFMEKYGILL